MNQSTLSRILVGASLALLAACGGQENAPPSAPTSIASAPPPTPAPSASAPTATKADKGDLLAQLKDAKVSLADGVKQAEQLAGPALSAKFELEDGALSLSVYAAKSGLDKDAEHNVLVELAGDPTKAKWEPKTEVFEDKAHLARSAMHLTLLQRSGTTLAAVLAKVAAKQPGTVYSITPMVKDKKPAFQALVAAPDGKSVTVVIDG